MTKLVRAPIHGGDNWRDLHKVWPRAGYVDYFEHAVMSDDEVSTARVSGWNQALLWTHLLMQVVLTLDFDGQSRAQRFTNPKRRARRRRQIFQCNRRRFAFANDSTDCSDLIGLTFVLLPQFRSFLFAAFVSSQRAKIIDDQSFSAADDLDALLGQRAIAFVRVNDRRV